MSEHTLSPGQAHAVGEAVEEFVVQQVYPEPGQKARGDYRNYDNPGRETVR